MLQFGIRAHDMGRLPAESLAEALAGHTPASIQLALAKALSDTPSRTGSMSPGYARRIRSIFERRGIRISVLGCYINPVHPDPEARDAALARFEEHLRFARDFGCAVVGTETGSCSGDCSYHPDTEKPETFDLLCSSIERLLRTAERSGSIVGVEPVAHQHTVSTIEKTAELLNRFDSPNLQVIYDPVNLVPICGLEESQESFFERALFLFGDRIAAVHAKDFRIENGLKDGSLPAGTGMLDYPALFRRLSGIKPFIDVLLENTKPDSMGGALAFVRRIDDETSP
jgi:L-ribulose-5-phosphate 3-epimerase